MARRTRSDMDAELVLRMTNRTDITSAMRGHFLDDAYRDICDIFDHPILQGLSAAETLPISTDHFTPTATDIWYPVFMRNETDGFIIDQDSQERLERLQTKPTTQPRKYYWYNSIFYFDALANTAKTIKVWYKKTPPVWTTNSPTTDESFDPLIIMRAAIIGFETIRDFSESAEQEKMFERYAAQKSLPLRKARMNDRRQGFRVRLK